MKAGDLTFLSDTAELTKLDFGATRVSLLCDGETMSAHYLGHYTGGERWIAAPLDAPAFHFEANAGQLQTISRLFKDEDDVRLRMTETALVLKSKHHNIQLKAFPVEEQVAQFTATDDAVLIGVARVDDLLAEATLAMQFTARSVAKLVLTGLHCQVRKGAIRFTAFNGFSALFRSQLRLTDGDYAEGAFVLPAAEVTTGLGLLHQGDASLYLTEAANRLILVGERGRFECSTLTGEWPDLSSLSTQHERQPVTAQSEQLRAVVSSVRAFEASNSVEIVGKGARPLIKTRKAEAGQYVTELGGTFTGDIWFDVEDLASAARLGDTVTLEIATTPPGVPTLVRAGNRRLWITPRVAP